MSWLARSIANSLNFDEDDVTDAPNPEHDRPESPDSNDGVASPTSPSRGVKEDLSELSNTLTRQFWGVASFLAPPPQPEPKSLELESDQGPMLGIRSDFAEIGGKFRSGISRLSTNINVSEITKMASNLLQLESDDDDDGAGKRESLDSLGEGAVGVTEDVVAFARDIAMHPQTWLDFPLPENVDLDFDMTDDQQEHALAVERLSPRLAALRIELCPGYMPESCFWMIYFVLLHPRLDKQDAGLLSTPQVLEARALLGHELKTQDATKPEELSGKLMNQNATIPEDLSGKSKNQNATKPEDLSEKQSSDLEEIDISCPEEPLSVPHPAISENEPDKASGLNIGTSSSTPATPEVVHNQIVERTETQTVDKPASTAEDKGVDQVKDQYQKSVSSAVSDEHDEDNADDWLKEETSEADGKNIPIENEDDVSFSDLEEDDEDVPTGYRKSNYSSDKDSRDFVQLGKSSANKESGDTKESNDWQDVDDIVVS